MSEIFNKNGGSFMVLKTESKCENHACKTVRVFSFCAENKESFVCFSKDMFATFYPFS